MNSQNNPQTQNLPFKAETRKLLDILIHSLYSDRDIFLRELISNASDALTRIDFEMLTNREVQSPEVELSIHIDIDSTEGTITVSDSGIGMTGEEMEENLGTIAHSGARLFVDKAQINQQQLSDIIGQFGVGFYSIFMVADSVQVVSRSYRIEAQAHRWNCAGTDYFSLEATERDSRGTSVILHLKEDAKEYLQESRIREIIRKHSDFVAFPIYIGSDTEQVNRQTALWRQQPREVEDTDYDEFFHQLTLDFTPPLQHIHMVIDAPVQMYALLYIPGKSEKSILSIRREDGLRLYSRNVLIQEYCKDLLPDYLRFVQGVIDSEDLPINVSRETYLANRVISHLRKLVTAKMIDILSKMAQDDKETYDKFWREFGHFIKEGIAIEPDNPENLYPLIRFHTNLQFEELSSLDDYLSRMKEGQKEIYFLLGDDLSSINSSPHLEAPHKAGYEVIFLTEPIDSFMLIKLKNYKEYSLANIAGAKLTFPDAPEAKRDGTQQQIPADQWIDLIARFKEQIGEQVVEVRMTDRLFDSPARLVDPEGIPNQEMQRVYKMLHEDFVQPKKILELNPGHPILLKLNDLEKTDPRSMWAIQQIYENALLLEGLHPNPAKMISRVQNLIEAALSKT